MNVVVPYQNDHRNGEELKFSIRSLVKHFRAIEEVILVGDLPTWFKGEYIPLRDIPLRREYSMYVKAMAGAKQYNIDSFLYTTDDHFITQDFDESLPNYHTGLCKSTATGHTSGRYRKLYANCVEGWLNFDCHVPIVMKPFNYGSPRLELDTPIKSTYANKAGVEGTPITDCKFFNGHRYEQIMNVVAKRQFFSTSPFCMNGEMMRVLNELYPDKSKFEK